MINIKKTILAFLAIVVFFIAVVGSYFYYQNSVNKNTPLSYYYKIIKNQENILSDEKISEKELADLKSCGDDFKCFLKYYEDYNTKTSLEKSFSNLSLLLKDYPEFVPYCHQITHGIGHSELLKNKGDLGKSLQEFEAGKYFTNISTCGSGYFHGLIEQSAKEIKNKDKLATFFTNICNNGDVKKIAGSDCIHGLGHSTFLQLDYNLEDSLYVCDKVVKNDYEKFNCYTGVFMEMNLDYPREDILTYENNNYNFKVCDLQEGDVRKNACYFESVLQFGNLTKKKNDFEEMSRMCQTIANEVYKLACVKNIAIRSVIDNQFKDIEKMCLVNTKSRAQRVFCVTNFAHRIAQSIDGKKGEEYKKISTDICNYLRQEERPSCLLLLEKYSQDIYFTTTKDLYI